MKNDLVLKQGAEQIEKTKKRLYDGDMVVVSPMYIEPIVAKSEDLIKIVKKEYVRFNCGQLKRRVEKYKIAWEKTWNIRRGDWIVFPRLQETPISNVDLSKFNKIANSHYRRGLTAFPLNEDTSWVLGLYVAEGHTNLMQVGNMVICFTLNRNEVAYAKKICKIFKSLGYKTSIRERKGRSVIVVRVSCTALARAFQEWFGKKAIEKQIPDFLMYANRKVQKAFLQGLVAGDGYIKKNKVHFHTSSKVLALQVQLMIAAFGAMVGISYTRPYIRFIRGKKIASRDSWQLRGSSKILASIFDYQHQGPKINHVVVEKEHVLIPIKGVSSIMSIGDGPQRD